MGTPPNDELRKKAMSSVPFLRVWSNNARAKFGCQFCPLRMHTDGELDGVIAKPPFRKWTTAWAHFRQYHNTEVSKRVQEIGIQNVRDESLKCEHRRIVTRSRWAKLIQQILARSLLPHIQRCRKELDVDDKYSLEFAMSILRQMQMVRMNAEEDAENALMPQLPSPASWRWEEPESNEEDSDEDAIWRRKPAVSRVVSAVGCTGLRCKEAGSKKTRHGSRKQENRKHVLRMHLGLISHGKT